MLLTIVFGFGIGRWFGYDRVSSLWFGRDHVPVQHHGHPQDPDEPGLLGTLSSRVMIGMLIVQDLAVVPLMIILPQLNDPQAGLPLVAWAVLKAALFLGLMLWSAPS